MTNVEGKSQKTVGKTYGLRTWIEYGGCPREKRMRLDGLSGDGLCLDQTLVGDRQKSRICSLACSVPLSRCQARRLPRLKPLQQTHQPNAFPGTAGGIAVRGGRTSSRTCGSFSSPMCFTACSSPGSCCLTSLAYELAGGELIAIMNLFHASLPI
jgi:hypothetical protein